MKSIRWFSYFTIFIFLFTQFSLLFAIDVMTEEFPPFNFTRKNRIVGVSTEIVEEVLKKAKIDYNIKSFPWARSYDKALGKSKCLIYTIGRTKSRERLFKWIGVLLPSNQSVFALKARQDIKISDLSGLKKYRIGTTVNDFRESYLISKGFTLKDLVRTGGKNSHIANYLKLKEGSIDLWPMPNAIAKYIAREQGDYPDKVLQIIYPLTEISKNNYYLAASLVTDDMTVFQIQESLKEFKKTQLYKDILDKWGIQYK